ncbi:MAG: hypothetical protein Q9M92_11550 [Enterobacterales bacterium]|nr:hypothetical protein [Enterobacterales bacterium]
MNDVNINQQQAPKWFLPLVSLALVWNLMGVMAFYMQVTMTDEMIAKLSEIEQAMYNELPIWYTIAFAIAVFGGALGSLMLLLKNKLACPIFLLSFLAVLVQMFYSFVVSDAWDVYGPGGAIMPAMIVIIAIGLMLLSRKSRINGWIG